MKQQSQIVEQSLSDNKKPVTHEQDHPGVRFPPPLVHVLAVLAGGAIHYFAPRAVLPVIPARWIGGVLLILALILAFFSFRAFKQAKTTLRTDQPVSTLVTTGIYHYSRNPNYLSMTLLFLSLGILFNSLWIVALLVPVSVWLWWRVVPAEETYLLRVFEQDYVDYQTEVRRWI
jgi:protein-S-isoprenylcysteine O-methyltransferase Ste14